MRGKIDTNLGWLRVVKTRPVSYEWSNRYQTAINKALKEEDIDFKAVIILDQDIENLIIGEG